MSRERFVNRQMVKKHIVTGTLSQLDAQFYIDVGKAQLQQNFVLLSDAKNEDYAVRGSINYIIENGESVVPRKDTERKSIEANRGRHLNEDLGLKIPVETTLSGTKFLAIPNQGIALSALNPKTSKTDKSIGSSDLLNIGDGGGYYGDKQDYYTQPFSSGRTAQNISGTGLKVSFQTQSTIGINTIPRESKIRRI